MKLSPGDTIQIILTVGGVPFAKTLSAYDTCKTHSWLLPETCEIAMRDLLKDIDLYADEPALGD